MKSPSTLVGGAAPGLHGEAVTRAIRFMRQRIGETQDLQGMAEVAFLSPFHFHRVFRAATGAPPGRFLTALRMATAKSLLLETGVSATEVSIAVGYSSLGTFTSQFARYVGVPPGRFRAFVALHGDLRAHDLAHMFPSPPAGKTLRCRLGDRPDQSKGLTLIGMFRSSIPQESPAACAMATSPGLVEIGVPGAAGAHYALAVSMGWDATLRDMLAENSGAGLFVGKHHAPVRLTGPAELSIRLRPVRLTDPPVLGAFPLLLAADQS